MLSPLSVPEWAVWTSVRVTPSPKLRRQLPFTQWQCPRIETVSNKNDLLNKSKYESDLLNKTLSALCFSNSKLLTVFFECFSSCDLTRYPRYPLLDENHGFVGIWTVELSRIKIQMVMKQWEECGQSDPRMRSAKVSLSSVDLISHLTCYMYICRDSALLLFPSRFPDFYGKKG
jgi:hypothetical protein